MREKFGFFSIFENFWDGVSFKSLKITQKIFLGYKKLILGWIIVGLLMGSPSNNEFPMGSSSNNEFPRGSSSNNRLPALSGHKNFFIDF